MSGKMNCYSERCWYHLNFLQIREIRDKIMSTHVSSKSCNQLFPINIFSFHVFQCDCSTNVVWCVCVLCAARVFSINCWLEIWSTISIVINFLTIMSSIWTMFFLSQRSNSSWFPCISSILKFHRTITNILFEYSQRTSSEWLIDRCKEAKEKLTNDWF